MRLGRRAHRLAYGVVRSTPGLGRWNWAARKPTGAVKPAEPYELIDQAFPGFSIHTRPLRADDVTPWISRRIRRFFEDKVESDRGGRLLFKWTGWSRVGFMQAIYPDALFVHVHRHGGAVANSLTQQPWWQGWKGPSQWRWGPLSAEDEAVWAANDHSYLVLAALGWRLQYREIEGALDALPDSQVLRVPYEDVCRDRDREIERILAFADVEPDAGFMGRLALTSIDATAMDRWRETDLTADQVARLESVLADDLAFQASRRR